jgi:hypothetical protein
VPHKNRSRIKKTAQIARAEKISRKQSAPQVSGARKFQRYRLLSAKSN